MKNTQIFGLIVFLGLLAMWLWNESRKSTPIPQPELNAPAKARLPHAPKNYDEIIEQKPAPTPTTKPDPKDRLDPRKETNATIVTGRVYDLLTGEGVSGVQVTASGEEHFSAITDENGTYEITTIYPGAWELFTHEPKIYELLTIKERRSINVTETGTIEGPDFEVDLGFTIYGMVADDFRNPLADATILFGRERIQTDSAGQYEIRYPEQSKPVVMTIFKQGYAMRRSEPIVVFKRGAQKVNVILEPESTISGQVVDSLGEDVAWAEVYVYDENWNQVFNERLEHQKFGHPGGFFRKKNLPPGTYSLFARQVPPRTDRRRTRSSYPPFKPTDEPLAVISIGRAEHKKNILLTMQYPQRELSLARFSLTGLYDDGRWAGSTSYYDQSRQTWQRID
jgi:hypothetical protein